jgi:hypothetical protein
MAPIIRRGEKAIKQEIFVGKKGYRKVSGPAMKRIVENGKSYSRFRDLDSIQIVAAMHTSRKPIPIGDPQPKTKAQSVISPTPFSEDPHY